MLSNCGPAGQGFGQPVSNQHMGCMYLLEDGGFPRRRTRAWQRAGLPAPASRRLASLVTDAHKSDCSHAHPGRRLEGVVPRMINVSWLLEAGSGQGAQVLVRERMRQQRMLGFWPAAAAGPGAPAPPCRCTCCDHDTFKTVLQRDQGRPRAQAVPSVSGALRAGAEASASVPFSMTCRLKLCAGAESLPAAPRTPGSPCPLLACLCTEGGLAVGV